MLLAAMSALVELLRGMVVAAKTIPALPSWREVPMRDGTVCRLTCALAGDTYVIEGLTLEGATRRDVPDRDVMLQLTYVHPSRGQRYHLARVEWRPRRPHVNDGAAPGALRYLRIAESQIHPFNLNARRGISALLPEGNLPVAEPLLPEPADYWEFLDQASGLLNIDALAQIGEPPWAPRLNLAP